MVGLALTDVTKNKQKKNGTFRSALSGRAFVVKMGSDKLMKNYILEEDKL